MISKLNYKQKEKIIIIVTVVSLILVFSGITYAYFTANNPRGSTASIISQSGKMLINYDDGTDNILPITDIQPSNNIIVDKTFSLTGINTTANNGLNMPFSISLEYQNTFQNWELEYFLKRMDTNENVSCTLKGLYLINEEMNIGLSGNYQYPESLYGYMSGMISDWSGNATSQEIAYGEFKPSSNEQVITLNLRMMFPDTGHNQDHNKGATFNGKIVVNGSKASAFAIDSWETIANNVNAGNSSIYSVGSEKEVEINGSSYTVRVANNSTPAECNSDDFSQTACGFVIEFVDIVELKPMNSSNTSSGGWPAAGLRAYANGNFFNALPDDLQNVIINTIVISGSGIDNDNFISMDKIYLLSPHEIWEEGTEFAGYGTSSDTSWNNTRQLDYYETKNVKISANLNSNILKNYKEGNLEMPSYWWLRSSSSNDFCIVGLENAPYCYNFFDSSEGYGFSPAFRIGERETAVDTVDKQLITQDNSLYYTEIFTDNTSDANVRFKNFNQSVYIQEASNQNNNNYSIKFVLGQNSSVTSSNNVRLYDNRYKIIGIFNVKNADTGEYERLLKIADYYYHDVLNFDTNGTNNWGTSSLMQLLNTEEYINNLVGSTLKDKIANVEWDIGGLDSLNISLENAYKQERGLTPYIANKNTWTGKIGLPSLTDYLYSNLGDDCSNDLSTCSTLANLVASPHDLTLTKDNTSTSNLYIYNYDTNLPMIGNSGYVYPTFYLKEDVEFVCGDGTWANPYAISYGDCDNHEA